MLRLTKHINKPFTNISTKSSLKLLYSYNRSNITSITYASMRTLYVSNILYKNKVITDKIKEDEIHKILNKYTPLTTEKLQDIVLESENNRINKIKNDLFKINIEKEIVKAAMNERNYFEIELKNFGQSKADYYNAGKLSYAYREFLSLKKNLHLDISFYTKTDICYIIIKW